MPVILRRPCRDLACALCPGSKQISAFHGTPAMVHGPSPWSGAVPARGLHFLCDYHSQACNLYPHGGSSGRCELKNRFAPMAVPTLLHADTVTRYLRLGARCRAHPGDGPIDCLASVSCPHLLDTKILSWPQPQRWESEAWQYRFCNRQSLPRFHTTHSAAGQSFHLQCGLRLLTSRRQRAMIGLASNQFRNPLPQRHGSHSLLLALFLYAFRAGLPGWLWTRWIAQSRAQVRKFRRISFRADVKANGSR